MSKIPAFQLFSLLVLTSCSSADTDSPASVVRDSAGVRIVESGAPSWSADQAWRVDVEALLTIGGGEDDQSQLFRVRGALRMADGRIAVANSGSYELRFYDATGEFISASGAQGGGPGEFENISLLRRYRGDSIFVYDGRQRRATVFDNTGAYGRNATVTTQPEKGIYRIVDVFGDGTILGSNNSVFTPESDFGFMRNPILAYRFSDELIVTDSLGVFPGGESYSQQIDMPGGVGRGIIISNAFFGRGTNLRSHAERMYNATNDTYEVQIYDRAGTLLSIVRKHHELPAVTDVDVDQFITESTESMDNPDLRTRFSDMYEDMPRPDVFPAYQNILIDELSNLWVREYQRPGEEREIWSVFDSDGAFLGVIEFPLRFEPVDIGVDYALGTWTDDLDVEYVKLLALNKP